MRTETRFRSPPGLTHLEAATVADSDKVGGRAWMTFDKAAKDALVAEDPKSEELLKPILRGRDIKRYQAQWKGLWVILAKYGSHEYLQQQYPAIFKHLSAYKTKLQNRGQCRYGGKGNTGQHHWLELDNNPTDAYLAEFMRDKIVFLI